MKDSKMEYDKILITSDLHLNHKRIREFCPESRGGYSTLDEMNDSIINNINKEATENSLTYIVGDLVFGEKKAGIQFLARMNGYKVIIEGNHDKEFLKIIYNLPKQEWEYMGLLYTTPYKEFHHTVDNIKRHICLFHFPIRSWHGSGAGSYQLHGHLHSPKNQIITHRQMDIGVDGNDMHPHLLDDVIRKLSVMPTTKHHGD